MASARTSRTGILSVILSLAIFLCQKAVPMKAFMLHGSSGWIYHQRSEISHTYASSSRIKSVLNNDNTREDMEDNVLLLPLLEAELVKLKGSLASETRDDDLEDTQRIQELKDTIDNAKTAAELGVRRVQAEFYDAFSTADFNKMSNVWSRSNDVCCAHPGMHSLQGITPVMESWKQIFSGSAGSDDKNAFQLNPSRVKVDICGRTAICTCVEETNGGRLEALNIYRREGGTWKMINHMASPVMM